MEGLPVVAQQLGDVGGAVPIRIGMFHPWIEVRAARFLVHTDCRGDAEPVVAEAAAARLAGPAAAREGKELAWLLASAEAAAAQTGLRAAED